MSEVRGKTKLEVEKEMKRKEEIKKAIFIHNQLIDQFPEVYKHLKAYWESLCDDDAKHLGGKNGK